MDKPVTMTKNRLAIRRAFLDGKINAVCGYPGIGKTYLTMIHPTFIDGFFSKQYYTDKKKGIVNPDFPEDLLNALLRKIAVEPVPKEVQWWEAQGRFENLIEAEFRRGGDYQAVLR